MKNEKVIVGVLAGIATGALLGMLFAPNKGSKTRKKISKKSHDTIDDFKNKFSNLVDDVSDKFRNEKDVLTNAYANAKGKLEDYTRENKLSK